MLYISDAEYYDRLHEAFVFVDERQTLDKASVNDFFENLIQ